MGIQKKTLGVVFLRQNEHVVWISALISKKSGPMDGGLKQVQFKIFITCIIKNSSVIESTEKIQYVN